MQRTHFQTRIRWLSKEEGGRTKPPPGPQYASTARFPGNADQFSVALRWIGYQVTQNGPPVLLVDLTLLAEENLPQIASQLACGAQLEIMEGGKVVGVGEVRGRTESIVSSPETAAKY